MQSQMNVRIDEKLRQEGNMAWESIGVSPSEAVRMLWKVAAKNRNNPRSLRKFKRKLETDFLRDSIDSEKEKKKEQLSLVEKGATIFSDFVEKYGLEKNSESDSMPYKKLYDMALEDHFKEKGYI